MEIQQTTTQQSSQIYKLAWSWYDESESWLLEYPDKTKTKEEFVEDCIKALREVGNDYINKTNSWIGAKDWMEEASKILIKKYNYKNAEPITQATFHHFGSGIIDGGDEINPEGEDDIKWKEIIGNDLYNKAIKKNKKQDKILHQYVVKRTNEQWYETYFRT